MNAFDSDALIYASVAGHPLGRRVAALWATPTVASDPVGIGSLLLLPEVLPKPMRTASHREVHVLQQLLARLDLRPVDQAIADLAVSLGGSHRLKAADAVHLATAVAAGADRFITNNRRNFPQTIDDIDIVYPSDLPEPD